MREYLLEGIKKIGLEYTEEKIDNLIKYLNLLVEYNSHTNLTAIRDEKGINRETLFRFSFTSKSDQRGN